MSYIAKEDLLSHEREKIYKTIDETRFDDMMNLKKRHPTLVNKYIDELENELKNIKSHLREMEDLSTYLYDQRKYVKDLRKELKDRDNKADIIEYKELKKTLRIIDESINDLFIRTHEVEQDMYKHIHRLAKMRN
jgi:hypothetical protein